MGVSEMRVNSISAYSQTSQIQKVQYQNQYGSVSKVSSAAQSDTSQEESKSQTQINSDDKADQKKRNLVPTNEVIDFAINKDMNTDKELVGSTSKLETLDIQKAISDMKKDSIIHEYQTFVKNPIPVDGFVRQLF